MASIADKGHIILESLSLEDKPETSKKLKKRQISDGTYEKNTPSAVAFQRISYLGARKPGVVPNMWSSEEDELLRNAVKKYGEKNWRQIAEEVPNRNHLQCLQRWKKALRPGLIKGHWSKEEDALLLNLIKGYTDKGTIGSCNWQAISQQIPGRNAKQCRERWFLNLDPSINRGPWTAEEDARLLELATQLGGRWALIAKNLPGRTENSVKTRFHSLQRQATRARGWTSEEDQTLMNAAMVFGRDWGKIMKQLPGRSRGQVKKRFSVLTQHQPDLVRQVQSVEDDIAAGKRSVPNPPPPPIKPVNPSFLPDGGHHHQQQQQFDHSLPMGIAPSTPQPSGWGSPPPPSQGNGNYGVYQAPPPPPAPMGSGGHQQQQQKKGMFRKYGSSWMQGIVDNLDANALGNFGGPSNFGNDEGGLKRTNSQKVLSDMDQYLQPPYAQQQGQAPNRPMARQDSNIALLDKLLTESNAMNEALGVNEFDFSNPPPSMGGEVSAQPSRSKGLKQYNSWGSVGGGDFGALFNTSSNNANGTDTTSGSGAPQIMRTGSDKKLQKMGSSMNWGAPPTGPGATTLGTYDSTSDFKNFLQML